MNYELCEKLKDAGFPKIRFTTFTATGSDEVIVTECPTLSELIQKCGEKDKEYNEPFFLNFVSKTRWDAGYGVDRNDGFGFIPIRVSGSTPEEAVAHLYLTLNKKYENKQI